MTEFLLRSFEQDENHAVYIEETENNKFSVNISDKNYLLYMHAESCNSGYVINIKSNEVIPYYYLIDQAEIKLWLNGQVYSFFNKKAEKAEKVVRKPLSSGFSGTITAPMPGSILKVLVLPGSNVGFGEALIIMESMKMEMTISSPVNGTVLEVNCQVGQMVEMNSELLKLEQAIDEKVS